MPQDDLGRHGVTEQAIATRNFTPEYANCFASRSNELSVLLREGLILCNELPFRMGVLIAMFGFGGLAILDKIRRRGFDTLSQRPKLNRWDFLEFWEERSSDGFVDSVNHAE